jgi:hypothetical protein
VTIGNSVTSIAAAAFYGTRLTSVTIPNSVTSIGNVAFGGNSYLTTVSIPDGLKTIGINVFEKNYSLTSILYCGKLSGFPITPTCPPERQALIDAAKAIADKAAAEAKAIADKAAAEAKAIADKAAAEAKAIADKTAADNKAIADKAVAEANRREQTISVSPFISGPIPLSASGLLVKVSSSSNLSVFAYNSTNNVCEYANGIVKTKASGRCVIAFSQEGNSEYKPAGNLILDFTLFSEVKKTTINCVKGKLTKKVTAVKPKCPAGYKVKK